VTELNVAITFNVLDGAAVGCGQRWRDKNLLKYSEYSTVISDYDNPRESAAYTLLTFILNVNQVQGRFKEN
jgi:hypothetical protein